jgi:lysophospholipase L1-like esterase
MGMIKNVLLVLASFFVTIVLVELVLRVTPYRFFAPSTHVPKGYWATHEERGYDIAPNRPPTKFTFLGDTHEIWSNELGCFDRPYEGEQPLIYLTGDSFTWGFAPFENKWGTVLESVLATRVLKCGVDGYGTRQELLKTTEHLKHMQPALVIVGYLGANDIDDDARFPNYGVYDGYRARISSIKEGSLIFEIKKWLSIHSVLYNLAKPSLRTVLLQFLPDALLTRAGVTSEIATLTPLNEQSLEKHLESVDGFKSLAKARGSRLLFVLIPARTDIEGAASENYSNARTKQYLESNNIEYIDLLPVFRDVMSTGKDLYWDVDGHWNPTGNHLAGLLVAEYIVSHALLSPYVPSATASTLREQIMHTFGVEVHAAGE